MAIRAWLSAAANVARALSATRERHRLRRTIQSVQRSRDGVRVGYLTGFFPAGPRGADGRVRGGAVKLLHLDAAFPHTPADMNCLYAVSSVGHAHADLVFEEVRRRGVKIIWNQNGVYYPAWSGSKSDSLNAQMAALRDQASFVIYQSSFCQRSADQFLGVFAGPSLVLHNPVDTDVFTPGPSRHTDELVMLTLDTPFWHYRLETSIRVLALVAREHARARLVIPGGNTLANPAAFRRLQILAEELGVRDRVEFLPGYRPHDGAAVLRMGSVLLHPQYNDACPNLVVEAMACGLPVVYSATGGVPELVGDDAGCGVPGPIDYDRVHPPNAEDLAAGVLRVFADRRRFAEAARQRAVERFSVLEWTAAHRRVFETVLEGRSEPDSFTRVRERVDA